MNELVFRAINAIEEGMLASSPHNLGFTPASPSESDEALRERARTEIESGIVQLESLLNATVDRDFDKFEIYVLRNILAVSHAEEGLEDWVRLDHYKDLEPTQQENAVAPEELHRTRRKLQETLKLNAMLKEEEARNAATLQQLHSLLGTSAQAPATGLAAPFAFLNSTSDVKTSQHLTQNVQHALNQSQTVRSLLQTLRPSLSALPNTKLTDSESEAARRRYLDAQARRALERQGLDPDAGLGAEAGFGKRVAREDLEGMERVVQSLGGAQPPRRREDVMEE